MMVVTLSSLTLIAVGKSQIIAPSLLHEIALLKQECHFLREQVEALKADRTKWEAREARWDAERARLEGIIERQTAVLPAPERSGWFARLVGLETLNRSVVSGWWRE